MGDLKATCPAYQPPNRLTTCAWAWRIAVVAPLVLAAPWLWLCRSLGAPAETGTVRVLLLALLLLSAAVTDFLWRRIYNWTTYTAFAWVVVLELLAVALSEMSDAMQNKAWTAGPPGSGMVQHGDGRPFSTWNSALGMLPWRDSLTGFAAGFSIMFVLYNIFRGGAGDLKLVAVLGALVGPSTLLEVLIYSYILAAVFAACLLVGLAGPVALLASAVRSIGFGGPAGSQSSGVRDCLKRQVPMAPFFAGGTLIALVAR